jgi:hypothetical protein
MIPFLIYNPCQGVSVARGLLSDGRPDAVPFLSMIIIEISKNGRKRGILDG